MATNFGGGNGVNGKTVRNGNSAPATSVGVNGDFYINTSANAIYGPKSASAWGSPTSLIGAAGATGSAGADGADGADGVDGVTSINYKGSYVSASAYVPGDFVVHSSQTYIATHSSTNSTPPSSSWDSFPFVAGTGNVATDTIWDLKGDLVVGTGADTASRLSAAPDGKVLMTASAAATGLTWSTPASGGNTTSTTTHSARPSPATNGNLFLPSDGLTLERDTGAAYAPWGPIYPFTVPVDGDFTALNAGAGVWVSDKSGVVLQMPAEAAATHGRYKTAPSAPYVITAWFQASVDPIAACSYGLLWRQSSDAKDIIFVMGATMAVQKQDNLVFNANYKFTTVTAGGTAFFGPPVCLRITDNNTNRLCEYSFNGVDFVLYHSVSRTDFLTANQVGWFGGSATTFNSNVRLLSWKES